MTTVTAEPEQGGIPYERIVQWLAGPISIVAGAVAVWLDNHFGLLGKAGLGGDQTAKAIFDGITFVVGAALTYLAHAKWMTNLTKWWETQSNEGSTVTQTDPNPPDPNLPAPEEPVPAPPPDDDDDEAAEEQPFVDEPGYDDDAPGVEPDQPLDQ